MSGEPTNEMLVGSRYAAHMQQHPCDEKAEGDRRRCDEREPCEHRAQEDEHRMADPDPNGNSFDRPVPRLENGCRPTVLGPGDSSAGPGEGRVHSTWFPN